MSDDRIGKSTGTPIGSERPPKTAADRADPRGQALRDNLMRRKVQARGRAKAATPANAKTPDGRA